MPISLLLSSISPQLLTLLIFLDFHQTNKKSVAKWKRSHGLFSCMMEKRMDQGRVELLIFFLGCLCLK